MMANWKFPWRAIRQRVCIAPIALLSIAFAMASAQAADTPSQGEDVKTTSSDTTIKAFRDKEKSARLATTFDEHLVPEIRKLTGVHTVAPTVSGPTVLHVGKKKYRFVALGVDTSLDPKLLNYAITAGDLTNKKGGIVVDEAFAASAEVRLDQKVDLLTPRGFMTTHVVGTYKLRDESAAPKVHDPVLIMPIRAAQYFFFCNSKLDSAFVELKRDADRENVRAAIQKILPADVEVCDKPNGLLKIRRRESEQHPGGEKQ